MSKFEKGKSGNPSGRPKSDTANLKPLLAKHGKNVLQKVVDAALSGELTACKLILDRLYPPIKAQSATVNIEAKETLTEQGQAVIASTLDGSIAPDIAQMIMNGLANQAKLIETTELIERIEALENAKETN